MIFTGKVKPSLSRFGSVWQFRGIVPEGLTVIKTNHLGQRYRDSKTYNSKEEAIKAANELGLKTFRVFE